MKEVGHLHGLENGVEHDPATREAFVGLEIAPLPGPAGVGAIGVTLVTGEGSDEVKLTAGLGPAQAREAAARLLALADIAEHGSSRTVLVVTKASSWVQGQALTVRWTPEGFHYQFAMSSAIAVPEKPKLILSH